MRKITRWAFIPVLFLAALASAQDRYDPATAAKTVAPFVTDRTLIVAHVDMTKVDLDAAQAWIAGVLKKVSTDPKRLEIDMKGMERDFGGAKTWVSNFTKAGGKQLYVVGDDMNHDPMVVVPLGAGADKVTLTNLMLNGKPEAPAPDDFDRGVIAATISDCLVCGPKATVEQFKNAPGKGNPIIEKALVAAGEGTGQAVFIVSDETRKKLKEELPPNLPPELGGGPTDVLINGVQYITGAINGPPNGMVNVTVQAKDAAAAKALVDLIDKSAEKAAQNKDVTVLIDPLKVRDFFKLTIDGDKLTFKADQAKADRFIDEIVAPIVKKIADMEKAPPNPDNN